jgi:hypothetical protein
MIYELQSPRPSVRTRHPQPTAVAVSRSISVLVQISKAELVALAAILAAGVGGLLQAAVRHGWDGGSVVLVLLIALVALLTVRSGVGALTHRPGTARWQNLHDQRTCPWCNNIPGSHRSPRH